MATKKNNKFRDMKPRKDAKGGGKGGGVNQTQGAGHATDALKGGGFVAPIKNPEA